MEVSAKTPQLIAGRPDHEVRSLAIHAFLTFLQSPVVVAGFYIR
jgi:hypothetical protein